MTATEVEPIEPDEFETPLVDGDHPDVVTVTYHRSNAALELVEDLTRIVPPEEWGALSLRMLDKDVLLNEVWWGALQRRRFRALGRPAPKRHPSLATRVHAGHLLAAVVLGRSWVPPGSPTAPAEPLAPWDYREAQRVAWERSGGACQADGLHHQHCPGRPSTHDQERQFVTHHVYPREAAKRDKVPRNVVDNPANLIVVWNGFTGLGAGGCHGRIHRERTAARRLGLLARTLPGA